MIFVWPPCWSQDGLLGVILVLGEPVTEWAGWDGWAWSSTGRGRTLNSLTIEKCVLPPQLISGFSDSKNVRVAMDKMRQQTTLAHVNAEKGLMMFHRGLKTRFISHGLFWCLYGFT